MQPRIVSHGPSGAGPVRDGTIQYTRIIAVRLKMCPCHIPHTRPYVTLHSTVHIHTPALLVLAGLLLVTDVVHLLLPPPSSSSSSYSVENSSHLLFFLPLCEFLQRLTGWSSTISDISLSSVFLFVAFGIPEAGSSLNSSRSR